jgi:hypothetical protein
MGDLISRKAVTTEIHNYFKGLIDKGIHNVDVVDCSAEISKRIDGIQAAYDVDKVVERFEKERKFWLDRNVVPVINLDKAISIVKGGGQR